jgi:DNA repair photolyase
MYEWVTHTANPLTGECKHKCQYCYVNKLKHAKPGIAKKYSGNPEISEAGLKQISGEGKFIFICDMTDLFADNVHFETIMKILDKCKSKANNQYLLQTKNTRRLFDYLNFISTEKWVEEIHNSHFEKIFSICTTFESNRYYPEFMGFAPKPIDRILEFKRLGFASHDRYITIEPIMDFDLDIMVEEIKGVFPKQVNIGADSGRNNLPEPSKEKILNFIKELEKFTVVKQKSNLARLLV